MDRTRILHARKDSGARINAIRNVHRDAFTLDATVSPGIATTSSVSLACGVGDGTRPYSEDLTKERSATKHARKDADTKSALCTVFARTHTIWECPAKTGCMGGQTLFFLTTTPEDISATKRAPKIVRPDATLSPVSAWRRSLMKSTSEE